MNKYLIGAPIDKIPENVQRPFWSVMIPTCNRVQYLQETLQSVLEQDLGAERMQIMVVDDCSTESDPETLVKSIGRGRVEFYRSPERRGQAGNWNTCLNLARGYWIHLLHDDDLILPGFYETFQIPLEKNESVGAGLSGLYLIDENSKKTALWPKERETAGILENWLIKVAVEAKIQPPAMVVKRQVYEELGGFLTELKHCPDWEMWPRIATFYDFWYEPRPLACYRNYVTTNISGHAKQSGNNIADIRKAIDIIQRYIPGALREEIYHKAREYWALLALRTARGMLSKSNWEGAGNQIRESLQCSSSPTVLLTLKETLSIIQGAKANLPLPRLDIENKYQQAEQYQQEKQYQKAIALATEILDTSPQNFKYWFELGNLFLRNARMKKALESYQKAIQDISSQHNSHQSKEYISMIAPVVDTIDRKLQMAESLEFIDINSSVKFPTIEENIASELQDRPFWSVMITTYQRTAHLEKALNSVLCQAPGPEEMQIEVINDGADLETQNKIREIVKKIGKGRVSFYVNPNVKQPEIFNICIRRAKGHWIHILHDDDQIRPGFYQKLRQGIEQAPQVGAAFCRHFHVHQEFDKPFSQLSPLERETSGVLDKWIDKISLRCRVQFCSIVVKRQVYEKLGGFCLKLEDYGADWEMWKRIAVYYPIWYETEPLAEYYYHKHSNSIQKISENLNQFKLKLILEAIEVSRSYLPSDKADILSAQARLWYSSFLLNRGLKFLQDEQFRLGLFQLEQASQCLPKSSLIPDDKNHVKKALTQMLN